MTNNPFIREGRTDFNCYEEISTSPPCREAGGASIGCPRLMAGMCRSVIIRKLLAHVPRSTVETPQNWTDLATE
jgi:hypothetical protein